MNPFAATVGELLEAIGERLGIRALTGASTLHHALQGEERGAEVSGRPLIGPLNCIHPYRIQVIGHTELAYLTDLGRNAYCDTVSKLFDSRPAAILFSDGIEPGSHFFEEAARFDIALLSSTTEFNQIIIQIQYYLTHVMAERMSVHGVFMEVLGVGVLLTGDAAVGKSELALALLCQGHRLIADDVPEFSRIAPDTLMGSCPKLLRDFLEVRGLGVLNIRHMYGDSAVTLKKELHLIVHLRGMSGQELACMDRLEGSYSNRCLLGLEIPVITVPVAPGRNLAVLVEAAVLNHSLKQRGYDASLDISERQRLLMDGADPDSELIKSLLT